MGDAMLVRFVIRALFAAVGLWLSARLVPGVHVRGVETLLVAAVLLGLVNAFVRPVVVLLTLPLTIVTLGLFLLIVNALMIMLVSAFLHGFEVHGLIAGVLAAIVTGVTSWIGHLVIRDNRIGRRF
jgi:putative membrane protein